MFATFAAFIKAHWVMICAVAVASATALQTLKNAIAPYVQPQGRFMRALSVLIDLLSVVPKAGKWGSFAWLNLPLVPSFGSTALVTLSRTTVATTHIATPTPHEAASAAAHTESMEMDADAATSKPMVSSSTTSKLGPIIALLVPLFIFSSFSCAWPWLKKETVVLAKACGTPAMQQEVTNLLPIVEAILAGGSVNWAAQLTALESVGKDLVLCTVNRALADTQIKMGQDAFAKAAWDPVKLRQAERAKAYLFAKGVE